MLLASDNFTRPNENPLAAPWVSPGPWEDFALTDNAIGAAVNGAMMYYSGVSFPDDQWSMLRWGGTGIPNGGPAARINTTDGSCYFAATYVDNVSLYLWTPGGGYQQLTVTATSWSASDELEIRVIGSSITAWKNGVQVLSTTDSTLASGPTGAFIFPQADRFTYWEAGDFTSNGGIALPWTGMA